VRRQSTGSSGPASLAGLSAPAAPRPRTRSSEAPGTPGRSGSGDSAVPSPGSRAPSSLAPLPLVHEPPFFDEVLGQLKGHRQLADLGPRQSQLAFLGIAPTPQSPAAGLQENTLPALELMGRNLAVAGNRIERLASKQAQDQLGLPLRAPPFRKFLRPTRRRGFF